MLSDRKIKNLKPRTNEYTLIDSGSCTHGRLQIRVRMPSLKEFFFIYSSNKIKKRIKIGNYHAEGKAGLTLKEARKKAVAYSDLLEQGVDPKAWNSKQVVEKKEQIKKEDRLGTLEQLFQSYVQWMKSQGRKTWSGTEQALKRDVLQPWPELASKKARDICVDDMVDVLAAMIKRGITTQTNRVRSYIHAAFNHGIKQDNNPRNYLDKNVRFSIAHNPVSAIPVQTDWERVGERFLSEEELCHFWSSLPDIRNNISFRNRTTGGAFTQTEYLMSPVMVYYYKLFFSMAGLRVQEMVRLRWNYVNWKKELLEIPPEATKMGYKTGKWHVLPLSALSLELLTGLYQLTGDCACLFPATMDGCYDKQNPINNTTPVNALRKHTEQYRNDCKRHNQKPGWQWFTPRDMRRTLKTLMGEAGISKEDRDKVQNHSISDVSSRHYDRYDYLIEKKTAIDNWSHYLRWVIGGCDKGMKPVRKVVSIQNYQGMRLNARSCVGNL